MTTYYNLSESLSGSIGNLSPGVTADDEVGYDNFSESLSGAIGNLSLGATADDLTTFYNLSEPLLGEELDEAGYGPPWEVTASAVGTGMVIPTTQAVIDDMRVTDHSGDPADPTYVVDVLASATIWLNPALGYHAIGIVDNGVPQAVANPYVIDPVVEDHAVVVTFEILKYTITPTAGAHGTISPNTPQTVDYDGSKTFSFIADENYIIYDVLVDDVSVGAVEDYTFDHVTADHTIEVYFVLFTTSPVISYIDPTPCGVNRLITIYGINFGENKDRSRVVFSPTIGESKEVEAISWEQEEITCYTPEIAKGLCGVEIKRLDT